MNVSVCDRPYYRNGRKKRKKKGKRSMIWYWIYCVMWWILAFVWCIIREAVSCLISCCRSSNDKEYKYRRKAIPVKIRNELWVMYYQNSETGNCYCCDVVIERYAYRGWHAAHVVSVYHGGTDELHNLRPTCPGCNLRMGVMDLYDYIESNNLQGLGMATVLIRRMERMQIEQQQRQIHNV